MSGRSPRPVDVSRERLRRALAGSHAAAASAVEPSDRYSLIGFTQYRWAKYRPAKVHRFVAEQLERVERGEIDRLMIRMPPRSGKSELAARSFPAYCLGRNPACQFIAASASASLAHDIGRSVRNLVKSEPYRLVYPGVTLSEDSRAAGRWTTSQGGSWYSVGVGGDVLGRGADVVLIDDPFRTMADAQSATIRENVWRWFNGTVLNRLEPGGAIVIIGHRMHEDDLQGRLEERMRAGGEYDRWTVLELPAFAEDDDPLGRAPGEALWPERFPAEALDRRRANMIARDWSALYQQRPVAEEGEFFVVGNMRIRDVSNVVDRLRAWDIGATKRGDWTSGVKLARTRDGFFQVEHVVRLRGRPDEVEEKIYETACADGTGVRISLPQDPGAAGVFQVQALTRLLAGFDVLSSPETGDKVTRARPFAAQCGNGSVSLAEGAWNAAYLDELRAFPHGKFDDQVDASSRAFMVLSGSRQPMEISAAAVALIANPRTWCGADGPVRGVDSMGMDASHRYDGYLPTAVQ
jgi:predicted phage terminase large subunit-like protein